MKPLLSLPLVVLLLFGGGEAFAQRLHFGTNLVIPGSVITFNAPLNGRARMETGRLRLAVGNVQGAFVAPATLTNLARPCPLLVVSVPSGGSAIRWMPTVTNLAWETGWMVLAADGPRVEVNDDTIEFGLSLIHI